MQKKALQTINQTLEFWQSRTPIELSRDDARQITENITGFFQVLFEWEAADNRNVLVDPMGRESSDLQ
jgi:hypothetical protein